ncbi:MAG: arginase family protein [Planctomycetota bacterium]
MTGFDPDAAAQPGSGLFGLDAEPSEAGIVVVPVPFAATVSYGGGAEHGPDAVLAASHQVDLYDWHFGRTYEAGIAMLPADPAVAAAHERARALAAPIVARGGVPAGDPAVQEIDAAGELVNNSLRSRALPCLQRGQIVGVLGGDHSVPFAAIEAAAELAPLGILHIDAHADMRCAYEGFRWSHASIMHNVLELCPGVERLVQIGVRDYGEAELRAIHDSGGRVVTHFDADVQLRRLMGESFDSIVEEVLAALPQRIWISCDIDGLDPSLCPNSGTPVPGGLQFAELAHLFARVANSGRSIVGFDLVEVAPSARYPDAAAGEWDANVGARVLYKLCGAAARSRHNAAP